MANVKISELPVATASSALAGVIPINVGSTTHSILGSELLAPIGKVNNDVGFTLAGGTTFKTLTVSLDGDTKDIPTEDGKAAADAIGAASGADTGAKIKTLVGDASTSNNGVALLGASGGAAKLTKMPDGATAVYSQDAWADADGWTVLGSGSIAVADGRVTFTKTDANAAGMKKVISNLSGKTLIAKCRVSSATLTLQISCLTSSLVSLLEQAVSVSTYDTVVAIPISVDTHSVYFRTVGASGLSLSIDWIWIGDYSYLPGSLSEEAARIADQLGDTPGVGAAATATITSNGTNVNTPATGTLTTTTNLPAADSTFKVGTKTYTWKSSLTPTEGEVLLEATVAACLTNARNAVNGTAGTLGTKHQCTANTLFTATASATILTVTAKLRGTVGNGATYEIVAGAGSELTASGALATGGVDDTVTIGGKVYTFVGQTPSVEGQVLVGGDYASTLDNFSYAIDRFLPASYDGVRYKIAAANPLAYGVKPVSPYNTIPLYAGTATGTGATQVMVPAPGINGNQITIAKSASATTLTLSGTTLSGGVDDAGAKIKTQLNAAIGAGAAVGAIPTKTATAILGYFAVADCASGAQVTLPAGGTWAWEVMTYGATYNSVKSGTSAGGAAITGTASANLCMRYERIA